MHWVLQMGFTSLPWVLQAPAAQANPSPASWRAPIMPDAVRGKQLYEQLVAELEEMGDSDALEFVSQLCKQTPPSGEFDSTDLQWFKHVFRGREVWDALIPLVDLARLLAGEAARCNTDKFTKASMKESGYCLYACACAGQARPKAAGPRAHNARGHAELPTKKVGCPARFAVFVAEGVGFGFLVAFAVFAGGGGGGGGCGAATEASGVVTDAAHGTLRSATTQAAPHAPTSVLYTAWDRNTSRSSPSSQATLKNPLRSSNAVTAPLKPWHSTRQPTGYSNAGQSGTCGPCAPRVPPPLPRQALHAQRTPPGAGKRHSRQVSRPPLPASPGQNC
jgi:hypothetical protein